MGEPVERLSYRAPEIARMLGVSRSIVYRWIATGLLVSVRVGSTEMVLRTELDAFLARHTRSKGA